MELLNLNTDQIISNAIQKLNNFTNITYLSPGSKARMLLDILGEELGSQAEQFDSNVGAGLLRKAKGQTLDYIGEIFGLERLGEVNSQVSDLEQNFLLYTYSSNFGELNNGESITIEEGAMRISNVDYFSNDATVYVNSERIVLSPLETRYFFSARALNPGTQSNAGANTLVNHDFVNYADSMSRTLLVTNNQSITYGRDRESDDNYRYRIQKEKISSEAGNETAIRLALLVIPGVANVIRIPYSRGIGTCDWLISSSSVKVSEDLLSIAQEKIEEKQSVGMSNLAKAPVLIGVEFSFFITYKTRLEDSEKEQIKTQIKRNISSYVNNLGIGQEIVLDQVVKIVLNSSDQISSMGAPNTSENFSNVFLYKRSQYSNSVTRKSLIDNYKPKSYERIVLEITSANPINILDNN